MVTMSEMQYQIESSVAAHQERMRQLAKEQAAAIEQTLRQRAAPALEELKMLQRILG